VRPDGGSPASASLAGEALAYDPHDLTTHAVCLGMTGSGKTGLGITIVEEAALNGIPALVIDPKGDMSNLLLAFPELSPADFLPWVDAAGMPEHLGSLDDYAAQVSRSWREGLADWDMDGARIARMKRTSDFRLYTPGSDAGYPISIVQSLAAPQGDWERGTEVLREAISSTVSAILSLIGVRSDPITGREHNLISTIVERSWRAGQELDLATLIAHVQQPPFDRLGVLPLEVAYPEKERLELAMALNGLLASPRFAAWLEGDPLRVDSLLHAPSGHPRVSIFYLAHLSDMERLFFITLLLEQVRAWLRVQEGSNRLRAILYIDELYGLMPPYPANPPTKAPLLALLKQARSQGLGLVLGTQNPIDLDYKGLSNAGTWFVGKLQTANDRQRVLQGLVEASSGASQPASGRALDEAIGSLKPRTFVLHNVHDDGLVCFRTRHAMSYLRGPLTRPQIRRLVHARVPAESSRGQVPANGPAAVTQPLPRATDLGAGSELRAESARLRDALSQRADRPPAGGVLEAKGPPLGEAPPPARTLPWAALALAPQPLPAGVRQVYLSVRVPLEWAIREAESDGPTIIYRAKQLVYRPGLLARATVRIDNNTHNVHQEIAVARVLSVVRNDAFIDWEGDSIPVDVDDLDDRPAQGARFAPAPGLLFDARRLRSLERDLIEYLYRETSVTLATHPLLKIAARPDETVSQFKRRCYEAIAARRDADLLKLERQYEEKIERLEARIRREDRELEQDELEYEGRKREEMISAGESVLNFLRGRRQRRALSMASRKRRLTRQAKADIQESLDAIDDLEEQIQVLLDEAEREEAAIHARWSEAADDVQTIQVRPRKSDVFVETWAAAWLPYWDIVIEEKGGMQQLSLAGYGRAGYSRAGFDRAGQSWAAERPGDEARGKV
jgi:hypothetical protein